MDYAKLADDITLWIQKYFEENATPKTKYVVAVSGGKDSSVAAALGVRALGADRVIGVLLPQGEQADIDCSLQLVKHLGIDYKIINIGETVATLLNELGKSFDVSEQARINTPARIRMTTAYAVAACVEGGGRVVNTCNLSEDWVGYATKFGDAAGDFSPLSNLTVTEVIGLGDYLGLPYNLTHKVPIDGLCGKTDEDNLGFKYADLDLYIREGKTEQFTGEVLAKIKRMHTYNLHKLKPMPRFESADLTVYPTLL